MKIMECPNCGYPLEISEEEDVYGFLSETGIIGAVVAIPAFLVSPWLGIAAAILLALYMGYSSHHEQKENQIYRCKPCNKKYRGDNLVEDGEY